MDLLKSLRDLLTKNAPLLAAAIAPASPIASVILTLIGKTLNTSSNPEDILNKIAASPDTLLKLKQLELDHEIALKNITSKNFELATEDKKSARIMFLQGTQEYRTFLRRFAYLVTIGFLVGLFGLFLLPISTNELGKQFLSIGFGALITKWSTIIDFFYGSSSPE
jgi:hypothetical protein